MNIRNILVQEWDPLCIGENPNLIDEYDYYVADIAKLLNSNCSRDQLYQHLEKIEIELGIRGSILNREKAINALLSLDTKR